MLRILGRLVARAERSEWLWEWDEELDHAASVDAAGPPRSRAALGRLGAAAEDALHSG